MATCGQAVGGGNGRETHHSHGRRSLRVLGTSPQEGRFQLLSTGWPLLSQDVGPGGASLASETPRGPQRAFPMHSKTSAPGLGRDLRCHVIPVSFPEPHSDASKNQQKGRGGQIQGVRGPRDEEANQGREGRDPRCWNNRVENFSCGRSKTRGQSQPQGHVHRPGGAQPPIPGVPRTEMSP